MIVVLLSNRPSSVFIVGVGRHGEVDRSKKRTENNPLAPCVKQTAAACVDTVQAKRKRISAIMIVVYKNTIEISTFLFCLIVVSKRYRKDASSTGVVTRVESEFDV